MMQRRPGEPRGLTGSDRLGPFSLYGAAAPGSNAGSESSAC